MRIRLTTPTIDTLTAELSTLVSELQELSTRTAADADEVNKQIAALAQRVADAREESARASRIAGRISELLA